jgi:hypothetical protein
MLTELSIHRAREFEKKAQDLEEKARAAANPKARETFSRLAKGYRSMAVSLQGVDAQSA